MRQRTLDRVLENEEEEYKPLPKFGDSDDSDSDQRDSPDGR